MYQVMLFDIDGVMLSEERYFDASALTVYELFTSPNYLGLTIQDSHLPQFKTHFTDSEIASIRASMFGKEKVLERMKELGVNANWDMVYLQFAFQLGHLLQDFESKLGAGANKAALPSIWTIHSLQSLGRALRDSGIVCVTWRDFVSATKMGVSRDHLFDEVENLWRSSGLVPDDVSGDNASSFFQSLWMVGQAAFQNWYLGEQYSEHPEAAGKCGFLHNEVPLVQPELFINLLHRLRQSGVELGIATGRPEVETMIPLRQLGWLDSFDAKRITTATDVLDAQESLKVSVPLSKPHPYGYLRSLLKSPSPAEVLNRALPLPQELAQQVLIVGDSVADWLAARALGCDFAAVLTGLSGESARAGFSELGCAHIFSNVIEVGNLLA